MPRAVIRIASQVHFCAVAKPILVLSELYDPEVPVSRIIRSTVIWMSIKLPLLKFSLTILNINSSFASEAATQVAATSFIANEEPAPHAATMTVSGLQNPDSFNRHRAHVNKRALAGGVSAMFEEITSLGLDSNTVAYNVCTLVE
jgi:hypothetical protein